MGYTVQAGESYASIAAKLGNPRAFLNLMKANGGRGLQPGDRISLEGIDDDNPHITSSQMADVKNWDASQGYRSAPSQSAVAQGYMNQAAQAGIPAAAQSYMNTAAANIRTSSVPTNSTKVVMGSTPLSQRYMNTAAGTMPAVAQGNYGLPTRTAAGPTQLANQNKYGAEPQIVRQGFQPSVSTYGRRILPQSSPTLFSNQNNNVQTTRAQNAESQRYQGMADASRSTQQAATPGIQSGSYMKPVTSFTPQQTQAGVTARWKTYNEVATSAVDFSQGIRSYMDTGDETQLPLIVEYETLWALGLSMTQLEALGYVRLPGNNMRWQRLDSIRAENPGVSYNFGRGGYYSGGYGGGWGGGGGGGGTIGGGSGGVGGLINWRIG